LKPSDTAILGMVSEPPGRNKSERKVASLENCNRRPSSYVMNEGSTEHRKLADTMLRSDGVAAVARRQGQTEQLVKPTSPRPEMAGEMARPITGNTGKWAGGEGGGGWVRSSVEGG
jgi:hypothetical protein